MNIKKKFLIVLFIINLLIIFSELFYLEANAITLSDMESQAGAFITTGSNNTGDLSGLVTSITDNFSGLGQILTYVGAGVMVAATSYMGIKYMVSSPDKQAVLKQQLIGLVVSGIVIFGAYGIWKMVVNIAKQFD